MNLFPNKTSNGFNCSTVGEGPAYCLAKGSCNQFKDKLSDITLTIDQTKYTLPAGMTVRDVSDANGTAMCKVSIVYEGSFKGMMSEVVLLGKPFLQNFVISIAYESYSISLGLNKYAM